MVEHGGNKDTQTTGNEDKSQADDKGCDSIIITNDNRHIYPQASQESSKKPSWTEKGTLVVLALTFLAALYAGYEASRLANLTETAVTDSQIAAAKQATDTSKSLKFAQEAIDAANIGNRAWISPRHISVGSVDKTANSINVSILYDNAGKTPALDVSFHGDGKNLHQVDNTAVPPESYRNPKLGENKSCEAESSTYAGVIYPASNQAANAAYFLLERTTHTSSKR